MLDADYARTMATYNRWMNRRLYALCREIPDAERRRDRGAFFRSIHGTLNHLLYGDLAFLSRFTGDPPEAPPLGVDLVDDFDELAKTRERVDQRILAFADRLTPDWLRASTTYESRVDGVSRTVMNWILLAHFFNHQAHHRGQLTTLLHQMGRDVGTTDLPFMPGIATP